MTKPKKSESNEAFRRFEKLAARVVRVPKEDVDKREAERPKRKRRPSGDTH